MPPTPTADSVREGVLRALATVDDPELHRPITDLGMVDGVDVDAEGLVDVRVLLTIAACPMRDTLTREVTGGPVHHEHGRLDVLGVLAHDSPRRVGFRKSCGRVPGER